MNSRSANVMCMSALLVSCLALSACAHEGQVFDKGTKKPLAGAYVIAEWHGSVSLGIEIRSRCTSAEVTQADAEGRFRFPMNINPFKLAKRPTIYAYMPNYESAMQIGEGKPILLEPRSGVNSEKFKMVMANSLAAYCDGRDDDRSFLSVRKARVAELQSLAQTPDEVSTVSGLTNGIEFDEFGEVVAQQIKRQREADRIKANEALSKP